MSVTAQRALRSAIDERRFSPVYYLHGDDDFRKDEAVRQLIDAAVDPGTREFNFEQLRGGEADAERLTVALGSLPMFADRRVVVLRDPGALRKAARAALDVYLAHPAAETLLILVAAGGAKPDPDLARMATSVPFEPLEESAVAAWLVQYARKQGLELEDSAAALLREAVGSDLARGVSELDKSASYASGRAIGPTDVEAVVGVRRGETLGDLLDAVAARDARTGARLVGAVLAQPKTELVPIINALTAQFLAMAWGRAARDRGLPANRLESEYFNLLKVGRPFTGRPWGEAVKAWARHLPRWTHEELEAGLQQLRAADLAVKSTRLSSDEAVLESLVLGLCAPWRAARRVA